MLLVVVVPSEVPAEEVASAVETGSVGSSELATTVPDDPPEEDSSIS
jgi:hypothetical protein